MDLFNQILPCQNHTSSDEGENENTAYIFIIIGGFVFIVIFTAVGNIVPDCFQKVS